MGIGTPHRLLGLLGLGRPESTIVTSAAMIRRTVLGRMRYQFPSTRCRAPIFLPVAPRHGYDLLSLLCHLRYAS
jgi:hypothetical protein